jgi:nitrogenase-associated protein
MRINFYEKPGCINNNKQKHLLAEKGHTVLVGSILTEAWTAERLRSFFGELPVSEWFNPSAPDVKSGMINPARISEANALAAMLADPLLIRRPLIEVDGARVCGFDNGVVRALLNGADISHLLHCPYSSSQSSCADETPGLPVCSLQFSIGLG